MLLGIEIGGTKLQLGVGNGDGSELIELIRRDVDATRGAKGILQQIERVAPELILRHEVVRIGFGFGGPVDARKGRTILSHQIEGWKDLALAEWAEEVLKRPAVIGNDCDVASLAEARFGAGKRKSRVFFATVGTGVGGGFVVDGRLDGSDRPAIAEIGHLRPGLDAERPDETVESMASGWGIASLARVRMAGNIDSSDEQNVDRRFIDDLHERCGNRVDELTAQMVAQAAADGNEIALEVISCACQALGWAIAQVITLHRNGWPLPAA